MLLLVYAAVTKWTVWTLQAIIRSFFLPVYSTNEEGILVNDFHDSQESMFLLRRFASGEDSYS